MVWLSELGFGRAASHAPVDGELEWEVKWLKWSIQTHQQLISGHQWREEEVIRERGHEAIYSRR